MGSGALAWEEEVESGDGGVLTLVMHERDDRDAPGVLRENDFQRGS